MLNYTLLDKDFHAFLIYSSAELVIDKKVEEVKAESRLRTNDKLELLTKMERFREWNWARLLENTAPEAGRISREAPEPGSA